MDHVKKFNMKQKNLLKRALRSIAAGVQECDDLVGKTMDSDDAAKLFLMRMTQVAKLTTEVVTAINESCAANRLVEKIKEQEGGKKMPKAAKTRTRPHLRLVNGGG